jgi:hypothetical protein
MKHNKKRNTAFLYEMLLREGTKSAIEKNFERAKIVKSLLFEHFNKNTGLFAEIELYNALKNNIVEEDIAEKYLQEVKFRYEHLNKSAIFNEQTRLINKINKLLGFEVYNNFVPEYKELATISQIFNPATSIKEKILLERNVLEKIKLVKEEKQKQLIEHSDTLLLKTFTKKFNDKYGSLLNEQKELLSKYVNSFINEGVDLKIYLNEEIERLKGLLTESLKIEEIKSDEKMFEKTKQTINYLNTFREVKDISQDMLQKVLKIQQFVHEVQK